MGNCVSNIAENKRETAKFGKIVNIVDYERELYKNKKKNRGKLKYVDVILDN